MKDVQLNILMLEDVSEDAELAQYELRKAGFQFEALRVEELGEFQTALADFSPDIIISDYNLPTCNALDAYQLVSDIDVPFIIVSGIVGDEKAVEALKLGVTDLVSKNSLSRLPLALERALNEQKINREKIAAEHELILNKERLELAMEGAEMGAWDLDLQSENLVYSERSHSILGFGSNGSNNGQISGKSFESNFVRSIKEHLNSDRSTFERELCVEKVNGSTDMRWVLVRGKVLKKTEDGVALRASGTVLDITDKKRNEEMLERNRIILEKAESVANMGSFEWDVVNDHFIISEEFQRIFEIDEDDEIVGGDIYKSRVHEQDSEYLGEMINNRLISYNVEHRIVTPESGAVKVIKSIGTKEFGQDGNITKIIGVIQDITAHREVQKSIFDAQKFERKRIARDIHDGIGQMLVAAKFKLASLDTQNAQPEDGEIDEVEDLLATIIEEVRRVSRNLSNRHVEEFGLSKALHYLLEEIINVSKFKVDYDIVDIPDDYDLDLSNAIYRVVQESLNNIIKYAEANIVTIRLEKTEQNIILEVVDDGKGFDINVMGNGVKNMQERASLHNGHCEIISELSKGTKIKAWFPLA